MPCQWCGDTHRIDQLCQRAQRGLTRRSFCFLFWAGLAAAALPFSDYPSVLGATVPIDTDLFITSRLYQPRTLSFITKMPYTIGRALTVNVPNSRGEIFTGNVTQLRTLPNGYVEITASEPDTGEANAWDPFITAR